MSVTLSSLPGKFKCSLLNCFFCPDGITPNSGLTGANNIYIIIIIIMSRRLRGYPWPSLAISPYHSSPPAGLQGWLKKTPQIAPPHEKKGKRKKNPKHLKYSLTRAKDESHKRVDSSSLFLSLSLSFCPPLDDHVIYPKIYLNFNIQ